MFLSETFLGSTIPQNDEKINIKGYSLLRADHPGNSKRGGVCLYYKEYLPLIARNDISCMQECLVAELSMNNEKCFFTCLYRSPSQSYEELDTFSSNLDLLLSNINNNHPNCSILIGEFNAKFSKWCSSDKDNKAGCELDNITTSAGYSQMIDNESSSCIDLIFSSNPSLTKNWGIEHSIYDKCHHNIIYGTLNFKVPLPPPYYREIWDYKKANIQNIQKAISMFDWRSAFKGNTVNKNCKILTLTNIFENFIPHKTKKFDYRTPEWMNSMVISSLKKRKKLAKFFYKNPSDYNKNALFDQSNKCTELILQSKSNNITKMSAKLDNPTLVAKTYWSIISRFLNKTNVPTIPPVLVNGKLISDFKTKSEHFNSYFAAHCTPVKNSSTLPTLKYKTKSRLNYFNINEDDIFLIIKNLDSSKAHGWDNISIRMIKLCGKSIATPLKLMFKSMLEEGTFPDD